MDPTYTLHIKPTPSNVHYIHTISVQWQYRLDLNKIIQSGFGAKQFIVETQISLQCWLMDVFNSKRCFIHHQPPVKLRVPLYRMLMPVEFCLTMPCISTSTMNRFNFRIKAVSKSWQNNNQIPVYAITCCEGAFRGGHLVSFTTTVHSSDQTV